MNARNLALAVCEQGQGVPLGASCLRLQGREEVNFAVHSRDAERVQVGHFDESGLQAFARWSLSGRTGSVWHGFVPGITCGQFFGLRADGPYRPASGQRFNPAKLLMDPFARALEGSTDLCRETGEVSSSKPLALVQIVAPSGAALDLSIVHEVCDAKR